jgi:hypothetical protein
MRRGKRENDSKSNPCKSVQSVLSVFYLKKVKACGTGKKSGKANTRTESNILYFYE